MAGVAIPRAARDTGGFTFLEVLLAAAIVATVLSMSVPLTTSALDEMRTSMAARYLEVLMGAPCRVSDVDYFTMDRLLSIGK